MKIHVIRKFVLCILSAWFALVVFTDFIVVPTVFRTVTKRVEAGELGMKVFSALGSFEVLMGLILFIVGGVILKKFKTRRAGILFLLGTSVFAFAILGKFYLTPEISKINLEKYALDEQSQEYATLNQRHQFLHGFYVKLDSIKMLFLIGGLMMSFRLSRFDQEKIFNLSRRSVKGSQE